METPTLSVADVRRQTSLASLHALVKPISTGMLTVLDPAESAYTRPLLVRQFDPLAGIFRFLVNHYPLSEATLSPRPAQLHLSDPGRELYVTVTGTAQLSADRERIRQHWNPMVLRWIPNGLDDPNLALLEFTAAHADYWQLESQPLRKLTTVAKAVITRTPPPPPQHEHLEF